MLWGALGSKVARFTCVSRGAFTLELVDPVPALSVLTGVTGAVVLVHLTVHPC